uniref:Uncharacterized protein n=1 Tax=Romanomermis culicivorax TaxID=13658 RepID=A0A915KC47_ROMCU
MTDDQGTNKRKSSRICWNGKQTSFITLKNEDCSSHSIKRHCSAQFVHSESWEPNKKKTIISKER